MQGYCYDACKGCSGCVDGASQIISSTLAGLGNDSSRYSAALRAACSQAGADYWTCWNVGQVVGAHPELATRPAALCKAIGQCSSDCVASLNLTLWCAQTGGSSSGGSFPRGPAVAAHDVPAVPCT